MVWGESCLCKRISFKVSEMKSAIGDTGDTGDAWQTQTIRNKQPPLVANT